MKSRRYILIAVLVLVLIGIAYIQALFSNQDHDTARPVSNDLTSIPADILDEYVRKEEASARIDSVSRLYADSLMTMKERWSTVSNSADSMTIDSLQGDIDRLSRQLTKIQKEARRAHDQKDIQFEKMVAAFYRGEMKRLPADLSPYEHKVSVEEIKDKAINYFEISSKELSRIIKKYE